MDFATVSGLSLGGIILAAALIIGGVPIETLLKPEALLVVFGGTAAAVLVNFTPRTLNQSIEAMTRCLSKSENNTQDCIEYMTEVARFVRTEGMLALQPMLEGIELPFLRKGLTLLVDHRPEKFIRESLGTEIEVTYREEMDYARVFEAAGGFAPTMGIIGAVIGLIRVSQFLQDPLQLGQGVAGAFSATLYGVALSNLFLLPMAGKLRQRARDTWFQKTLILEGIMSIQGGEHPLVMEEKLNAFLSQGFSTGQAQITAGGHPEADPYAQQLLEV